MDDDEKRHEMIVNSLGNHTKAIEMLAAYVEILNDRIIQLELEIRSVKAELAGKRNYND